MYKMSKWIIGLSILAILTLALGVITFGDAVPNPDTLIWAAYGGVDTMDPSIGYDVEAARVVQNIYDRLVMYNGASTDLVPSLATKWEVSPDGTTYTFYLRKGVKFHDGTEVTAKDVKYSFDRMIKINKGPAWIYTQDLDLNSVKVIDDYTVQITLTHAYAPFLYTIAYVGGSIMNSTLVMSHETDGDMGQAWLQSHDAGSGPYVMSQWVPNVQVVLNKFADYWHGWDGKHVSTVIIKPVTEVSDQKMMLSRGDIDIAGGIDVDQIPSMEGQPGINVFKGQSLSITYIGFNCQKQYTNNPLVRQAISYAFDYAGVLQGVLKGNAIQLQGPVPQGLWGHDNNLFVYPTDLKKAKALMAQAGYPDGGFSLTFAYYTGSDINRRLGLALQSALQELGVTLNIQGYTHAAFYQQVTSGADNAPDVFAWGWVPDYADPDDYVFSMFDTASWGTPGNATYYSNPVLDNVLAAAQVETDHQKRVEYYMQAQALIVSDAPWIFVYQQERLLAMRNWVKGFAENYNPMLERMPNFYNLYKEAS